MTTTSGPASEDHFHELTEPLVNQPDVTRSTMMGLPCLRRAGAFFASHDRRTGNLVVKLAEARVTELIGNDQALPFAPAGRRFREWAAIPPPLDATWVDLLAEAHASVARY